MIENSASSSESCERCGVKNKTYLQWERAREENSSLSPDFVEKWLCPKCHNEYMIEVAGDDLDCL